MHNNSLRLYLSHGKSFVQGKVLELGPDATPSSLQGQSDYALWETADHAPAGLHGCAVTYPNCGEYDIPVPSGSYDTVISANVFEHVRMPWCLMCELARITRKGGHVITVVPALYHFHEFPIDCWRIWPDGMRGLHEYAGLETVLVESSRESDTVADTIGVAIRR